MKKLMCLTFTVLVSLFFLATPALAEDLPQISGRAHVQDEGWVDYPADGNHLLIGTVGQGKRIEAISLSTNYPGLNLVYQTHVQDIGWQNPVGSGETAGTEGQAKRIECFRLNLEGESAPAYDLYYRTHVENYGWLDWALNGASAGTAQHAYRCEALEVLILPAGSAAPGATTTPAIEATTRTEAKHMYLVNQFRRSHGLNYLTGDPNLKAVADLRVQELTQSFSHTRPNGKYYETAVKDVFPNYRLNGGGFTENITFGGTRLADPEISFGIYCNYAREMDTMLEPTYHYMSFSGITSGTMGYAVELFSSLDRIDFAD